MERPDTIFAWENAGPLCRAARQTPQTPRVITYMIPILNAFSLVGIDRETPNRVWYINNDPEYRFKPLFIDEDNERPYLKRLDNNTASRLMAAQYQKIKNRLSADQDQFVRTHKNTT